MLTIYRRPGAADCPGCTVLSQQKKIIEQVWLKWDAAFTKKGLVPSWVVHMLNRRVYTCLIYILLLLPWYTWWSIYLAVAVLIRLMYKSYIHIGCCPDALWLTCKSVIYLWYMLLVLVYTWLLWLFCYYELSGLLLCYPAVGISMSILWFAINTFLQRVGSVA